MPDKPPLFFWLIAACYLLTGSLRVSFLLPSLLRVSAPCCWSMTWDGGWWNREAGLWAAAHTAVHRAIHVAGTARPDRCDPLFLDHALSLHGLLRHLLLRAAGGAGTHSAGSLAGLGVITKGVGFLPCWCYYRTCGRAGANGQLPDLSRSATHWTWAPVAFLAAIGLWLVPMLIAVALSDDPALRAYRDEILLHQNSDALRVRTAPPAAVLTATSQSS